MKKNGIYPDNLLRLEIRDKITRELEQFLLASNYLFPLGLKISFLKE